MALRQSTVCLQCFTLLSPAIIICCSVCSLSRRYTVKEGEADPGPQEFHRQTLADIGAWNSCLAAHPHDYCVRHYHPQQLIKVRVCCMITLTNVCTIVSCGSVLLVKVRVCVMRYDATTLHILHLHVQPACERILWRMLSHMSLHVRCNVYMFTRGWCM